MDSEQGSAIDRLSAVQVETLRLVYAHKNSKEIARIMNVSSHTVDERIRVAMRKLNVDSRTKAAVLVAEKFSQDTYQPLIYQPSVIGLEGQRRPLQRPQPDLADGDPFWMRPPFPTKRRPYNNDSIRERLLWPLLIAIATIMAFAALYAVMLGLGDMMS